MKKKVILTVQSYAQKNKHYPHIRIRGKQLHDVDMFYQKKVQATIDYKNKRIIIEPWEEQKETSPKKEKQKD